MHSSTLDGYKVSYQDIGENRDRATAKKASINSWIRLSEALNSKHLKKLAYCGWRPLWKEITGGEVTGKIIYQITSFYQVNQHGDFKLDLWHEEKNQFILWHSAKQFCDAANIKIGVFYRAIAKLKRLGFIDYEIHHNYRGRNCYFITLNIEKFVQSLIIAIYKLKVETSIVKVLKLSLERFISILCNKKIYKKENIEDEQPKTSDRNSTKNQVATDLAGGKVSDRNSSAEVFEPSKDFWSDTSVQGKEEFVPRVEQLVNTTKPIDKPVLKKSMAIHKPNGDRFFQPRNQQSEIRNRAKDQSVVGLSDFKTAEELCACQSAICDYYIAKGMDEAVANEKAGWCIKRAKNGEYDRLVDKYQKNELDAILPEYRQADGTVNELLLNYIRYEARRNHETEALALERVSFTLKNKELLDKHWASCKYKLDRYKDQIDRAKQAGESSSTIRVPDWVYATNRTEVPLADAAIAASEINELARKQMDYLASDEPPRIEPAKVKPPQELPAAKVESEPEILEPKDCKTEQELDRYYTNCGERLEWETDAKDKNITKSRSTLSWLRLKFNRKEEKFRHTAIKEAMMREEIAILFDDNQEICDFKYKQLI